MSSYNKLLEVAFKSISNKFQWLSPETLNYSIQEEEAIARAYGTREKGYARISSINDAMFNQLFPGAELECFASPLNSHLEKFCSLGAFDSLYGSLGNVLKYHITEKIICANPPNEAPIVKAFVNKVLAQEKEHDITLQLFVPSWPDLYDTLGDSAQYIKHTEQFSLDRLRREKIMTNGNPAKHGQIWVPRQPRTLLTFQYPSTIDVSTKVIDDINTVKIDEEDTSSKSLSAVLEESPFQEHITPYSDSLVVTSNPNHTPVSDAMEIRFHVDKICGIGSPSLVAIADALHHKLLTEFASHQLSLNVSRISPKRAELNEHLTHVMPSFIGFTSLDVDDQETTLQHAMSIAAGYYDVVGSTEVLEIVNKLYDEWCKYVIDDAMLDSFIMTWYQFSQRVITAWLCAMCPLLESLPCQSVTYPTEIREYGTITLNSAHDNISLNNVPCDITTSSHLNGIYFCTSAICDQIQLDTIYNSYRHAFDNLVVLSFELSVSRNISSRYTESATIITTFGNRQAYFTYLVVNTSTVDITFPDKIIDADDSLHVVVGSHYLNLSVESHASLELYKRMKDNRWLWNKNDLTKVFDGITKYMLEAHRGTTDLTIAGARYLMIALNLLSDNYTRIREAFLLSEQHPLVRRCGGEGVDLYLNNLPHNTQNLMFMVEYFDTELSMTPNLEMNMLDRERAIVGKRAGFRRFTNEDPFYGQPGHDETFASKVTQYKWTYKRKTFHSLDQEESNKILLYVYFYERYLPELKKFIVIQVLCSMIGHQCILEFVHPHDMTEVVERFGESESPVGNFHTINQILSRSYLEQDPSSYFPNIHVTRQVANNPLGVSVEPLVSMLENKSEVVEYMDELVEMHEIMKPGPNGEIDVILEPGDYEHFYAFGRVSKYLDSVLFKTNLLGWKPQVVNAVPRYYFDVYRDLSSKEFTLAGDRIQYHTARIEMGEHTLFPCPGSNFVWNCKIGHILSGACLKSLRGKRTPVHKKHNSSRRTKRNHR